MRNYYYTPKRQIWKEIEKKQVIFTDFFDTLVFRRIHSFQIYDQWAKALIHRLGAEDRLSVAELVPLRHQASRALRTDYEEPPHKEVMKKVYESLKSKVTITCDDFCAASLEADVAVELGCLYGNSHLIGLLRKAKAQGKRIYVVSDFYLPSSVYREFLVNAGCNDIIDGVFVSETCNRTKSGGDLYGYVLQSLKVKANDCMMFGDSKTSDVMNAEKNGIKGCWYFPLKHKVWTNISRILKLNYGKHIEVALARHLYKNTLFDEYALILYHFAHKLISDAKANNINKLAFFSRGGYLLHKSTDLFLRANHIEGIEPQYCYASRKVCLNTEDEENRELLTAYLHSFIQTDGRLVSVDEGWYCHSQQKLSKDLRLPTLGYYLGVRGRDEMPAEIECQRKGIVFDIGGEGRKRSKYYGIFCTNCSMYEQMLTSREGSLKAYQRTAEGIVPILKENETEHKLYDEVIGRWQERMLLVVRGLCAWKLGTAINERLLARMILRTSLFANKERNDLLCRLDASMIDNCGGQTQKAKTYADARIDLIDLLRHPDMYVGMACKVQRRLYKRPLLNRAYKCAASAFYVYVRILKGL